MISKIAAKILILVSLLVAPSAFAEGYTGPSLGGGGGGAISTDTTLADDIQLQFGTSADVACEYDTGVTPDSFVCGVGSDSRTWFLTEKSDIGTDWNRAVATNPTFCIQSANAGSVTQRICISHNQTDGLIDVDSGQVSIPDGIKSSAASGVNLTGTNVASGSANPFDITSTLNIMDGDDTFIGVDINLTNADHTGDPDSNIVKGINISNITGDDETLETAISIGSGWDVGINMGSNSITDAFSVQAVLFTGAALNVLAGEIDNITGVEEINGIQGGVS